MIQKIIALILLILAPTIIFAHGGHGNGFMAGFTHPILGLDHNIAILGSGILGYLLDDKRWYLALLAFISAMILGGFFGINKEATIFIEKTIVLSVLSIGLFIAFRKRINLMLILLLLFLFGFFHGYAHGAEMSESNTAFQYIPGYTIGAILISIFGVFIAKLSDGEAKESLLGGIIIGCGLMLLLL